MKFLIKPLTISLFLSSFVQGVNAQAVPSTTSHTHAKAHRLEQPDSVDRKYSMQNNSRGNKQLAMQMLSRSQDFLPFDLDVPGQAFVSTGPYIGVPYQYSGSDLVINSPSINNDLQLLKIRKSIHEQLMALNDQVFAEQSHSHLLLSGILEAQANYTDWGGAPSTTDIDMTNFSFGMFVLGPSQWLLGYAEMTYVGVAPIQDVYTSTHYYRVSNSRVALNKAFITIGNLEVTPFYGTVGQLYVPFGLYSSTMVSDTLPKLVGRTKGRAIQIGYHPDSKNTFYGAAYIFRGDSHANSVPKVNNGGINLGVMFDNGCVNGNIGAGIIANLADSGGMQIGGGFTNYEQIDHRVPAYNLRALLDIGHHFDFIAEYVGASNRFNVNDLSYNGRGAKPSAMDFQAVYSFKLFDEHPSSVGIGYGKSSQAMALGIPLSRTSLVFNTSILRNTLQSIEFRHDRNYAASDTANGPVGAIPIVGDCTSGTCTASGKSDNAVTAQFDYYF